MRLGLQDEREEIAEVATKTHKKRIDPD